MKTASFNRFKLEMPDDAVVDCSHQGECDSDVAYWETRIAINVPPEAIRAELKELGAWSQEELENEYDNRLRLIWVAACNIRDEECYAE